MTLVGEETDAFKSLKEIVHENGFKYEEYNVTTSDGYILGLYRIPGTINEINLETPKPAVLVLHALEMDMM
jgi:hypothetical protein